MYHLTVFPYYYNIGATPHTLLVSSSSNTENNKNKSGINKIEFLETNGKEVNIYTSQYTNIELIFFK